ncbi:hypothetical protein Tco_0085230 [Tanacetum coccineum]
MASMNTRLNIEKLDGNIVQTHGGSNNLVLVLKQESMEYMMKKRVWFEVELQGAQGDREAEDSNREEKTTRTFLKRDMLGKGAEKGISDWVEDQDSLVCPRNLGFNKSGEYKKTFIGSGVGTGLVQVLQGVKFEVEPQEDHTFEVEPHRNVDQELFSYREDNSETAFAVAAVEKIYAHKSLTFNNTVACEVISKWKTGLKDDMDARSDVYVLTVARNAVTTTMSITGSIHLALILATKDLMDKAKGNVLGMEIVRDESGDCDVEKNGKWSCIYAVGSQEYQIVCTRLDIASADVDQSQAGYMTLTKAAKEAIWLKGLAIESGIELKIVAGIATGALSKASPNQGSSTG